MSRIRSLLTLLFRSLRPLRQKILLALLRPSDQFRELRRAPERGPNRIIPQPLIRTIVPFNRTLDHPQREFLLPAEKRVTRHDIMRWDPQKYRAPSCCASFAGRSWNRDDRARNRGPRLIPEFLGGPARVPISRHECKAGSYCSPPRLILNPGREIPSPARSCPVVRTRTRTSEMHNSLGPVPMRYRIRVQIPRLPRHNEGHTTRQ